MSQPLLDTHDDEVSPLELFFDLVFVFAVSQLSEHLRESPTWVGAGQTAVILCAVFGIWAFSSFGVTFAGRERAAAASIFAVLFLALFINAAIPRAFTDQVLAFLIPFLVCRIGQVTASFLTAATDTLRLHFRAMLVWVAGESVLWIIGAAVPPGPRLVWWGAAAVINIGGSWAAHPLPGRRFITAEVPFNPGRMVERSRLLLLIALGETVLSIGTAISKADLDTGSVVTALLALVITSLLWFLYFRGSDPIVNRSAATASDTLRVARIAVNSQLVILAGLIAIAVANETGIEAPLETAGLAEALTLHLGAGFYLAAQTWYLHALTGRWPRARLIGFAALMVTVPITAATSALVGIALVTLVLTAIVLVSRRETRRADSPSPVG